MSNLLAPDGYRYGVMFQDGSVRDDWNGHTQRQRAQEYADHVLAEQREWLAARSSTRSPDNIRVVRRRPGEEWAEL